MKTDSTPFKRSLNRLRGFCRGASVHPMEKEMEKDTDYLKGYSDGRKARHDYAKQSAEELGAEVHLIKAQK